MIEQNKNAEKWLKFLEPENLKDKLIFSSLYIATFESFKDYLIEEVKFFFNTGLSDKEFTFSEKYKLEVLSKDKSILNATLIWLKEFGTISEKDIEIVDELRKYRNRLSHNLMELLFEGLPEELPEKFIQLLNLRMRIEKWWVINIEIPTDIDFNVDKEISEEDIITSSQIFNKIIIDMLSGDERKAHFYVNEFRKKIKVK